MPQWVYDFANSEDMPEDEYEYVLKYNRKMTEHIDDDEIADILKTLSSQAINEK
jgi:isopentenyldiphosphate isomerase